MTPNAEVAYEHGLPWMINAWLAYEKQNGVPNVGSSMLRFWEQKQNAKYQLKLG